jgi:two-component system CheB/CheR fusion protein
MCASWRTYLSPAAIAHARAGLYPKRIDKDVGEERLARFFEEDSAGYRVRAELRGSVVFGQHDVLSDPPFRHLDLVSCRNLLIYLERTAQRQVLQRFHDALEPGGLLFLGPSESLGSCRPLFSDVDANSRLFRRR